MIVITRPAGEAELTVARLRARGIDAEALPLIERTPLPIEWPRRTDILFLTSAFAAELASGVEATTIAALKKRTASGLTPAITADGGAVALAHAVKSSGVRGAIFYPTSAAAKHEPEHYEASEILRRCGELTVAEVYDTHAVADARAQITSAAHDVTWSFFSPSAVRAFVANTERTPARVMCTGASTLRAWRELKQSTWPDAETEDFR